MEENKDFRPLVTADNKFKPLKQIYNGYEIEKRWVLFNTEKDYTIKGNGITLYNEVLNNGVNYKQGYILDIEKAKEILGELQIEVDFKPNTIRFRKAGTMYILTLKDRKETKVREVEWELSKKQFMTYWPLTKGKRVYKKRLEKRIKGNDCVIDAFIDRLLLIAEIEVSDEALLSTLPELGMEVTGNKAYSNKALSK